MIGDSLYAAHDLGVDRIGEETLPQLTHFQPVDPLPTAPGRAGRRRPCHLRTGRAHGVRSHHSSGRKSAMKKGLILLAVLPLALVASAPLQLATAPTAHAFDPTKAPEIQ